MSETENKGVTLMVNLVAFYDKCAAQAFFIKGDKLVDMSVTDFLKESIGRLRFFMEYNSTKESYEDFKAYAKEFFKERGIEIVRVILITRDPKKVWQ